MTSELTTYLTSQRAALVFGTKLFIGPLPEKSSAEPIVAIAPYTASRPSEQKFGSAAIAFEWPRYQVLVRGPVEDLEATETEAIAVYLIFGAVQNITLSGVLYHGIRCLQPPFFLKWDANKKPIYAFNIEAAKQL